MISIINCLLCEEPLQEMIGWKNLIERYPTNICLNCHEQFITMNQTVDEIYCLYQYNDKMKDFFKRYKFQKDLLLATIFAGAIHHYFTKLIKRHGNIKIIPIPLHNANEQKRTFSQVETLLQVADINYDQFLVKKSMEQQARKTKVERLATTDLFSCKASVKNQSIVVFDDIKTTGVTLHLAKEALLKEGAKMVKLVALAGAKPAGNNFNV